MRTSHELPDSFSLTVLDTQRVVCGKTVRGIASISKPSIVAPKTIGYHHVAFSIRRPMLGLPSGPWAGGTSALTSCPTSRSWVTTPERRDSSRTPCAYLNDQCKSRGETLPPDTSDCLSCLPHEGSDNADGSVATQARSSSSASQLPVLSQHVVRGKDKPESV